MCWLYCGVGLKAAVVAKYVCRAVAGSEYVGEPCIEILNIVAGRLAGFWDDCYFAIVVSHGASAVGRDGGVSYVIGLYRQFCAAVVGEVGDV